MSKILIRKPKINEIDRVKSITKRAYATPFLKGKLVTKYKEDKNLKNSLIIGGCIIISAFTEDDPLFKEMSNETCCFFKHNELKELFSDFKILDYNEKIITDKPHRGCETEHKHGMVQIITSKDYRLKTTDY